MLRRLLLSLCLVLSWPVPTRAQPRTGVLVVLPGTSVDEARQGMEGVADASFRIERLEVPAEASKSETDIEEELDALLKTYAEAAFLECVTRAERPELDVEHLLLRGKRQEAGRVLALSAACAHPAGDTYLARTHLSRLFTLDLGLPGVLDGLRPDTQNLAEQVRSEVSRRPLVRIEFETLPAGAQVQVDGGAHTCSPTPCDVPLRKGEHVVVLRRLGQEPRTVHVNTEGPAKRRFSLDPANPKTAREQLARAVSRGNLSPFGAEFARLVSDAFEVQSLAVVGETGGRARACLYDRGRDRIVARSTAAGGTLPAVTAAVREIMSGLHTKEPRSVLRHPAFWATVIGVAAATAVAVFFVARPDPEPTLSITVTDNP